VFFDGPPGALLVTEDAVRASTLVVIPPRASGLDLAASQDCVSLCQETLESPPQMVTNFPIGTLARHDPRHPQVFQGLTHSSSIDWMIFLASPETDHFGRGQWEGELATRAPHLIWSLRSAAGSSGPATRNGGMLWPCEGQGTYE